MTGECFVMNGFFSLRLSLGTPVISTRRISAFSTHHFASKGLLSQNDKPDFQSYLNCSSAKLVHKFLCPNTSRLDTHTYSNNGRTGFITRTVTQDFSQALTHGIWFKNGHADLFQERTLWNFSRTDARHYFTNRHMGLYQDQMHRILFKNGHWELLQKWTSGFSPRADLSSSIEERTLGVEFQCRRPGQCEVQKQGYCVPDAIGNAITQHLLSKS